KGSLTEAQRRALVAAAMADPEGLCFIIPALIGLRPGEMRGLRGADIDMKAAVLHVNGAIKKGTRYGPPKTAKSDRTLAIPQQGLASLREQRKRQAQMQMAAGPLWSNPDGFVFTGPKGRYLCTHAVTRVLDRVCATAGVPRVTAHILRHTAASLLL